MEYVVIVELAAHTSKIAIVIYQGQRYCVPMRDLYLAYDDTHYSIYRELLNRDSLVSEGYDQDYSSFASMI